MGAWRYSFTTTATLPWGNETPVPTGQEGGLALDLPGPGMVVMEEKSLPLLGTES